VLQGSTQMAFVVRAPVLAELEARQQSPIVNTALSMRYNFNLAVTLCVASTIGGGRRASRDWTDNGLIMDPRYWPILFGEMSSRAMVHAIPVRSRYRYARVQTVTVSPCALALRRELRVGTDSGVR
jgi:hypothetical protein